MTIVVVVAAILAGATAADAQWWKEPAPANRLDQKAIDPSGETATRLKWDDGYVEVKAGATADRAIALNCAHEKQLALEAARQLAYFKLAEIVEGVAVDGTTLVKDAMVADQVVRTRVQGRIVGARVIGEKVVDGTCGAVWAEVQMGLLLRGPDGLAGAVAPAAAGRTVNAFAGDAAFRVNDRYTGVIVDASDTGFSPALAPRLVEEASTKVVFGPHLVQQAAVTQQGAVGYAANLSDARDAGRVGKNPLILRARSEAGARRGDLTLSARDAERLLAADREGGFLARGAAVIVLGKDTPTLAAAPGRRYALVVGVNDYVQGVDGAFTRLDYAARDAEAFASALTSGGGFATDAVTVLRDRDATRGRVLAGLQSLQQRVREDDVVVIYFAGHGSVGLGTDGKPHYYLVPQDGQTTRLATTALADDLLEELIGQIPSRQVVVILDACYSGGGRGAIRARGQRAPGVTAPAPRPIVEAASGRLMLMASKPEQEAWEHPQKGGGLFTAFLLEGLAGAADTNRDGKITVLELYEWVQPQVTDFSLREIQVEQTPVLEVRELSKQVVLTRRP